MGFSTVLRPNISSSNSPHCFKQFSSLRQQKVLPLVRIRKGKGNVRTLVVGKSVLNGRKPRINGDKTTDPPLVLNGRKPKINGEKTTGTPVPLEKLFVQTQKLEDSVDGDVRLQNGVSPGLNLKTLEADLQAALLALRKKEEDLEELETKMLLERRQLSRAKGELEQRDKQIAAASSKREKLEEELRQSNVSFASQARQIEDLKFQLMERSREIASAKSAFSLKEVEMNKMREELTKNTEEMAKISSELKSKSQCLDQAHEVVNNQEIELRGLQEAIQSKEEEIEVSASLKKLDEEKLKVVKANLEKQTMEYLITREELKKLAEQSSKHMRDANETSKEFCRVKQLLADVRSELVCSQKSLASLGQKMERQVLLLEKQTVELEEQKISIVAYLESLENAQVEVDAERVKLRVAEARNKELEHDLSLEKELIKNLQGELEKERSLLQLSIKDGASLRQKLAQKNADFDQLQNLLKVKEADLVEAKLEIQHLKSEQATIQSHLAEKDLELLNTRKKLEQVNREMAELKMLLSSKEDQLNLATTMLKEKDEHVLKVENELKNTKQKFFEAQNVMELIAELTSDLTTPVKDDDILVLAPSDDCTNDFRLQKRRLETELAFTREDLKAKEMEILAAQRALTIKDEELKTVKNRLDERDKELERFKEEMTKDANDLNKLYTLAQERCGDKTVGDLAIEKLELEAAQLEVEAATAALQKLAEMSREIVTKTRISAELDSDIDVFPQISMVDNCESIDEVKTVVVRLSALTEQILKEAGIADTVSV